jgi:hypothetical protein
MRLVASKTADWAEKASKPSKVSSASTRFERRTYAGLANQAHLVAQAGRMSADMRFLPLGPVVRRRQREDEAMRWDAARAASRRPLRKPYKPVAPVGEVTQLGNVAGYAVNGEVISYHQYVGDRACGGCGHIRCSCKPAFIRDEPPWKRSEPLQELDTNARYQLDAVHRNAYVRFVRACIFHPNGCPDAKPAKAHVMANRLDNIELVRRDIRARCCALDVQVVTGGITRVGTVLACIGDGSETIVRRVKLYDV